MVLQRCLVVVIASQMVVVDIVALQSAVFSAVVLQALVFYVVILRTVVDGVVVLQAVVVDVVARHCCSTGRRLSHRNRGNLRTSAQLSMRVKVQDAGWSFGVATPR